MEKYKSLPRVFAVISLSGNQLVTFIVIMWFNPLIILWLRENITNPSHEKQLYVKHLKCAFEESCLVLLNTKNIHTLTRYLVKQMSRIFFNSVWWDKIVLSLMPETTHYAKGSQDRPSAEWHTCRCKLCKKMVLIYWPRKWM